MPGIMFNAYTNRLYAHDWIPKAKDSLHLLISLLSSNILALINHNTIKKEMMKIIKISLQDGIKAF